MPAAVEVAPSILAADFACLGDSIRAVERAGVSLLHVDVMDGHFVPNISIGVPVVASLRKATKLQLDVHLMIENPEQYIEAFASAGADMISVHQEATPHLDRALSMIREQGCKPGAVINPATPVMMLLEVLGKVDHVLVMSVNPGFGGQAFIPLSPHPRIINPHPIILLIPKPLHIIIILLSIKSIPVNPRCGTSRHYHPERIVILC